MHPLSPFINTNLVLLTHEVTSKEWFRMAMETIQSLYKMISIERMEAYVNGEVTFNGCCHISFDDGDSSVYENAFPILEEMNIPSSLFVSPMIAKNESNFWFQELSILQRKLGVKPLKEMICETLGTSYSQIENYPLNSLFKGMKIEDMWKVINATKKKFQIEIDRKFNMTSEQLKEVHYSNLIKIGAHTLNHPILKNETDDNSKNEIYGSIEELSDLLGENIRYFAYPNGTPGLDYGQREITYLKEKNIKLAFTTDSGFVNKKAAFSITREGLSGSQKESAFWIRTKLTLLPFLNAIRKYTGVGRLVEERKEIRDLAIFKSG